MRRLAIATTCVALLAVVLEVSPFVPGVSPRGLLAHAATADCIALEDFKRSAENAFPEGWRVRKDAGRQAYSVRVDGGVRFLRASAKDMGIQAAKQREWDLGQYPVLAWKWRPREFPKGANEQAGKNDSVLSVYAMFPHSRISVKAVKYIWSEKVPAGTHLESNQGLTQVRVLRSGVPANRDAWVEERGNAAQDYRRFFKETELPKPLGIAVLTDSDDTNSVAEGDYTDFKACRS